MTASATSPSLLRGAPEARAVYDDRTSRWYSYAELGAAVGEAARALAGRGARRLAFLFCRNDLATLQLYLASLESGTAVVLLDAAMSEEMRRPLVDRYRPDLVLHADDLAVDEPGYARGDAADAPAGVTIAERREPHGHRLHEELAVMLPTSGTTGSPKLVRLARRNVVANAESIAGALGIDAAERPVLGLPMHYSYGLSVVNSHLVKGASIVMTDRSIAFAPFWTLAREQECTSFAGVPYSYQLLRRLGFDRLAPASMRTITQAGGRLVPELVSHFHEIVQRRGGKMFVMYGQTEATARIAILPADRLPEKLGSAGRAIPGGRLVIDADGAETTEPGREGEVLYEGPNVMLGYAEGPDDLARPDELRGRLRTGDVGYLDAEGFLFLTGRRKRISKIYGLRVNLDEVEAMLRDVGPVAVAEHEERIVIFCEAAGAPDATAIRQRVAASLKLQLSAFEVQRLERLPLLANGKVDYQALRQRMGQGGGAKGEQ